MDEDARTAGTPVDTEPRTPQQIRSDIEATREEVGDTVEALAAKTDVKARAKDRVDELKAKAQSTTPETAQQGGRTVIDTVRSNPAPFVLAGAVAVAFLLGRRSGRP
jgi:hypothetical protein